MNIDASIRFRVLHFVERAVGLAPFAWITGLVTLAVRVRLEFGAWPIPAHPDPKRLPFELHHQALWLGLVVLLAVAVGVLICSFASSFRERAERGSFWFFWAGVSLIAVGFFGPHHSLNWVAWFLD